MSRAIGSRIGEYRLLEPIGSGAAGDVFKAEHVITHRVEAIKFLAPGRPVTEEEERRFVGEIEVQASLQHRNITTVHNAFWTSEGLALVMEFVAGEPLSAILARGRVALPDGLRYVREALAGLEYAHSRGVVHGDIKPANLMVGADGTVKLTDFGLARRIDGPQAAQTGAPAGSPYYMSPEQVVGAPPDARSDIYSLGVVLYELVTGRRPFEGEGAFEVMLQQRNAAPIPAKRLVPAISSQLSDAIGKAMDKDPARRFQSAAEFRGALDGTAALPGGRRSGRIARWAAAAGLLTMMTAAAMWGSRHRARAVAETPIVHELPASIVPAPPPVQQTAPAASEPPATTDPPAGAPRKTGPARRSRSEPRAGSPRVMLPLAITGTEAPPVPVVNAPPPVIPQPEALPPVVSPQIAPPVLPEPSPIEPATEPAKKRNVVWRALGHIIHPKRSAEAQAVKPKQ